MSNFALVFLICSIVSFALFYVFSYLNYSQTFKMTYHFRNCFPYEFNFNLRFKENLKGNVLFLSHILFSVLFLIFFDKFNNNGFLIAAKICGLFIIIFEFLLVFTPLVKIRLHMTSVSFLFVLSLVVNACIFAAGYQYYGFLNETYYIFIMVFSLIVCFLEFALLMHPKLTRWAEMDRKQNKDGTFEVVRPKYFILPLYEWLFMFLFFVSEILLLIIHAIK